MSADSYVGQQLESLGNLPLVDSCQVNITHWNFIYDTTQFQGFGGTAEFQGMDYENSISELIYQSPNSSKAAMYGYNRFGGIYYSYPTLFISEINHQTGQVSPLINPQFNIQQPPIFFKPQLNEFANGDWLLTGNYSGGDFYFNDSLSNYFNHTSSTDEGFMIKFDSSTQQVEWTNSIIGGDHLTSTQIISNGNTYIFGDFSISNTVSLGSKVIQGNPSAIGENAYIAIIDTGGIAIRLNKILLDSIEDISIHNTHIGTNAYYITGTCRGDASFNNSNYANVNGANSPFNKKWVFVAKYDLNTDTLIWVKNSVSAYDVELKSTAFGANEDIYISGRGEGLHSFDGVNVPNHKSFITQYNTLGNLLCVDIHDYFHTTDAFNLATSSDGKLVVVKGDAGQTYGVIEIFKNTNCQFSSIDTFSQSWCSLSTGNQLKTNNVKVFPNPTSDNITIEFLNGIMPKNAFCKVFTTDGKLIFEKQLTDFQEQLSIRELPKGMYWLQIFTEMK